MIIFKNQGEIDIRGVTMFGVNVKDKENPFGHFGTGLKYAIAGLIRTGHEVTIYSGKTEYIFTVGTMEMRGKTFQPVLMNGVELPFTTELGKGWEPWMFYRELYCNCMDEGGKVCDEKKPSPHAGMTQVCVSGSGIEREHAGRATFILETSPLHSNNWVAAHPHTSNFVFMQGIAVGKTENPCLYTYNYLGRSDLTEDRIAKSDWDWRYHVGDLVMRSSDEDFIFQMLTAEDVWEERIVYGSAITPSDAFVSVCTRLKKSGLKISNAAREVVKKFGGSAEMTEYLPSSYHSSMLEEVLQIVHRLGFTTEYADIRLVHEIEGCLGMARNGQIYISRKAFEQGLNRLASTLLEECIHAERNIDDFSSGFQDLILDLIINRELERKFAA